jgi:WS/DGAT/MGAT family acyltransferase
MQQLSGQDATFLYVESPRTPMHIGALSIYDPSTAPGGAVRFKQILAHIEQRLHTAAAYRQRLVRVPFELDYPYWINDGDFDLEFHVRHIALPAPGDWRQLCIQVARLHSRILDLNKPLWEFYVIEGLDHVAGIPKGAYAILSKVHHAAIDGVSGTELTSSLHDVSATPERITPAATWHPESPPGLAELMIRTVGNNVKEPFQLLRVLATAAPALVTTQLKLARHELEQSGPVPLTRFNRPVSAHRVFEGRTFPLEGFKRMRAAVPGATINDAVLAVCGGAVRDYLAAKGELPEASLIAMAPVNVRSRDAVGTSGNQVSAMSVALRSDIAHPIDRLRAVHAATRNSKALAKAYGARLMTDINRHIPASSLALAGRLVTRWGLANAVDPMFNAVVTNVPGPQIPMYMNGARLLRYYGLGPVVDSGALFMPVLSYAGLMSISVTSCREIMPDPERFAQGIERAYHDAVGAVPELVNRSC